MLCKRASLIEPPRFLMVVKQETQSWIVPAVQFLWMTALAWVLSWLTYTITNALS